MSDKDDLITELRDINARQLAHIDELTEARDYLARTNHDLQETATRRGQEIELLHDAVVSTTAEYGKRYDSCREGMAEFISRCLSISETDALEALAPFFREEVRITIYATVEGREHDHITSDELGEFISEALGCNEVVESSVEVRIDPVD